MILSITDVEDKVFESLKGAFGAYGLEVFKRTLPKGVRKGIIVRCTDVTMDENQQAIFFALAEIPDVLSNGSYELNPEIKRIAREFTASHSVCHPAGASYRYELLGQSIEEGDDGQSHILSNRYFFTNNTE